MNDRINAKRLAALLLAALLLLPVMTACAPAAPAETGDVPEPVAEGLEEKLVRAYGRAKTDAVLAIRAGDVIRFGTYEKNNKPEDGAESVEWTVLEREGTKLLLISKFSLDCVPYNEVNTDVTWETCSLRVWLNGVFLETCFDPEDRAALLTCDVKAEKNPLGKAPAGSDVADKAYVLSYSEAAAFFPTDDERRSEPTAFAADKGAKTGEWSTKRGHATAYWWLRNPGGKANTAAIVNDRGVLNGNFFRGVEATNVGVRPVICVDFAACPKISFPRRSPLEPDLDAMD